MKKLIFILLLLPAYSYAQKMSCCKSSATESFAQLSADSKFKSTHLSPLPLVYHSENGQMITFKCRKGNDAKAFEIVARKPSEKWLYIFHEWWGLNDYIKREAENFSKEFPGVNILALDLYDGMIADNPEQAGEIMGKMDEARVREIIYAAMEHTGDKSKIATIGWCMGGGWSLQASLLAGERAIGCVMYYGMPETDQAKLKNLNADVLGIFGLKDNWITPEVVEKFQTDMQESGKSLTVKNYNAEHAFANPSNPNFNKEASGDAHKLVIKFLKEKLD
jgi:carboxymethylenebutenolidase